MTDQTEQQPNGGEHQGDSAEELRVRAEHRQALAKIESEDRRMMADMYRNLPIPLRVMFDPMLNERVKIAAEMMSRAEGFTPRHLLGKLEACFVVVTKALTWRLDPQAVASATYQTPDGKVGYEGKLVQAIIEASGKLSKPIGQGEYFGDWSKVEGRFKVVRKPTKTGGFYDAPEPGWEYFGPDEEGLGVRYEVWLKDQNRPLKFEFKLRSAYPRNATTWPTRPQQQLHYAAMRALGNVVCPSLIMGVPFQDDLTEHPMREINPIVRHEAPPPVDLEVEGIYGAGNMTAEDAAAQRPAQTSKLYEHASEQPAIGDDDGKPSWAPGGGKPTVQPGRAQATWIGMIESCRDLEELETYATGKEHEKIVTLPSANRQAVEHAIEHQRSVLEADRAETEYPMQELDQHEPEEFQRAGEEKNKRQSGFDLIQE